MTEHSNSHGRPRPAPRSGADAPGAPEHAPGGPAAGATPAAGAAGPSAAPATHAVADPAACGTGRPAPTDRGSDAARDPAASPVPAEGPTDEAHAVADADDTVGRRPRPESRGRVPRPRTGADKPADEAHGPAEAATAASGDTTDGPAPQDPAPGAIAPETAGGSGAAGTPGGALPARPGRREAGGGSDDPHMPPPGGSGGGGTGHADNARERAGTSGGGERLRFVGAATRRIARGIDLDEIVLGLCRSTVPTFADAILVYLRDPLPVGDERPVGPVVLRLRRTDRLPEYVQAGDTATEGDAATPDPGPELADSAAERCEVRIGGPLAEVLRGVRPVFGDSSAARAALPELLGEGRHVPDRHRTILAPLRGRRRVIGAAVFVRRLDRPAFESDDLLVAAQLATHTALGVDKAVLYGREVYIADELQRTMLPDSLPQPTGVRLASRYLPAAETARVGGDWYDAIPLPGNRVALVVGDVMGHSMTSAAIMGQLRTTAQTLAGLDLPPQEVLHHLDEQAQRLGSDRMATCLYAVYDPVAHRIVIANAGHPPPVLLHRGGRAEVLRVPPGAPIGVGGVDFEAVELDAPAGATLLLYTDGLVESRIRDVWTGIEQLRERLIDTARLTGPNPPPLEPLCDEVLGMLGPGDRDDDIALLAARFEGIAPSDVAYWFLDPRPQTPRQARRLARRALTRWGLEELTDGVELLVSEVITNAVRYAERPITLRLLRTDVLRCEVGDDVPQLPRLRQARPSDEGGRGLYLVNKMARRWGATRLSTGKVVWFELPLPAHGR
ncbi:SpoIIE family protein phosphatase [Streptomyces hesseae]|uniref:SpoIIE family protein phosphatase n=1 Tax=Streptomyces hesseae TaxID=3075519 RepID=A0ABU2SWL4_9ACTN|nr:SpoIIE family protein phosphatase [Streptomyces sp. DSM 40473]MDT0452420.1 SpoIIE family protein phosphatase [Streptomyces sp. DSM 40473]